MIDDTAVEVPVVVMVEAAVVVVVALVPVVDVTVSVLVGVNTTGTVAVRGFRWGCVSVRVTRGAPAGFAHESRYRMAPAVNCVQTSSMVAVDVVNDATLHDANPCTVIGDGSSAAACGKSCFVATYGSARCFPDTAT